MCEGSVLVTWRHGFASFEDEMWSDQFHENEGPLLSSMYSSLNKSDLLFWNWPKSDQVVTLVRSTSCESTPHSEGLRDGLPLALRRRVSMICHAPEGEQSSYLCVVAGSSGTEMAAEFF